MASSPSRRPPGVLAFIHIPKTAGTVMRTILEMNEPGVRSQSIGNVFKGGGGINADLIPAIRDGHGPDLTGARLVRGHVPLGIREYLPNCLPAGKARNIRYFTILREPVERTLSHYFAIVERGGGHELPPLPKDATLTDAIEGGHMYDNLQTRMLSDAPEPFGEVTDQMLAQAKRNLKDGLIMFGITERFDES